MNRLGEPTNIIDATDQFNLAATSLKEEKVKIEYDMLEDKFMLRLGTTHEVDAETLTILIKLSADALKKRTDFKTMGS